MNKAKNIDRVWWCVLGGVLAALAGYLILGIGWAWAEEESLAYFHREVFVASPLYKDRILSLCTLSVVPLFHWAYKRKKDHFAKGTMLLMVLLVLAIVFLQMSGE